MKKNGKKVFVGVSGGVDSSVSLALLQDQGYDVVGVFIRTWQPDFIECTWRSERRDAMRVCAHLDVPFVELDLEQEYKQGVADYMISEYKQGRTPNPDVMCNREVKFGGFLQWALKQGADYVATGHYAQNNNGQLYRGIDESKDQSYFLWTLTSDQLQHILFPIGHIEKKQVRKLAKKYQLPTAQKKDSQGICFIGPIDMKEFLSHYIDVYPGNIVDEQGAIIGTHQGAVFYTLGERHGFTITKKTQSDKPYYIIKKDITTNTITVSNTVSFANKLTGQSPHTLHVTDVIIRDTNDNPEKKYTAQVRYHGTRHRVWVKNYDAQMRTATIICEAWDPTIAPGQSVVLYDNQHCIGGGIVA